jgi:7-cyano-7-deazaguanine synthase
MYLQSDIQRWREVISKQICRFGNGECFKIVDEILLNSDCNHIHLLSGGLDSAYALLKKSKEEMNKGITIYPIFFDYGQSVAEFEWQSVLKIVEYLQNLEISSKIGDPVKISLRSDLFQWSISVAFKGLVEGADNTTAEIENRNMVLFSVLASYLIACANHQKIVETKFIVTSGFKDGEISDCKQTFFDEFSKLLVNYKKDFLFDFKTLRNRKHQIFISEIKSLLGWSEIELKRFRGLTISCYSPINGKACGNCYKCKLIDENKEP